MKRRILALILFVSLLLSLISCDLLWGKVDDSGKVTVVVENIDGSYDVFTASLDDVENKSEGAKGIIEHLKKENNLQVEMVESTYGAYVAGIGKIHEDSSAGKYVMVYTSVASDGYDGGATVDYNGTTMHMAGVGLSGMSVEAGTIILFRLESSPY